MYRALSTAQCNFLYLLQQSIQGIKICRANKYQKMASLRFMQLITQRLAKTFKDLNEAITMEITKMQNSPNIKSATNQQKFQKEYERKEQQQQIQNIQKIQIVEPINEQLDKDNIQLQEKINMKKIKKTVSQRPKKPQNSFKLFLNDMKKQASNQDEPNYQNMITKIATKKWQCMTNQEKLIYQQLQQKQIDAYHKNLQQFYNTNPQEKNRDIQKKQIKQDKKKLKMKEKQQEKQKQKQKQKDDENNEQKKRNFHENEMSANKQKQKSSQKKEKKEKQKKQKEEKNNLKVKEGEDQFKVQLKKRQSKIREKQKKNLQNESLKQKDKSQQQKMKFETLIKKSFEEAPIQDNFDIKYQNKKCQSKQNGNQNQHENTQKIVIEQQIVKPNIDQYLNLNDNSDSLGDI